MVGFIIKSLKRKLILLFLVVSLVPLAVVGYLSYSSGKETLKREFSDSLTTISRSRETAIILYLRAKTGRIIDFSSDGFLRDSLEKISQKSPDAKRLSEELSRHFMENKKPLDAEIYGIHVLDVEGTVIASTEKSMVGTDKSAEPYFVEGKKGVYIKSVYYSEREGKYLIAIAAPIIAMSKKEVIGVMVNRYELTGLNKITTDREGMGQTGEVYIVGKDGYMITQSRFVDDAILKQRVDTEPVKLFHKQKKNTTGIYPDYRGIPVVGASMGDELEEEFGLGWVIMAEVDSVEAFAPAKTIGLRILGTGLGAGIVVAIIAYFVARRIANPMVRISDQIARVGDGDLTVQIPYNYRRDEVGILAKTLVRMVAGLRDVTRGIMEGVNVLSSTANEILASTAQVASSSSETATAVSQTTTTVEEVKQTTQVSVQKATNVSDKAQKTLQISQTGKKSVEDTINGMHRILEQMAAISESIERLSEQRQAIGEIVATVDDLAEQTNLLSVNASIEAAKAGEEGKGFAVVAQEIRHLAELSKQATTQVRNILNNIQKSTSTAVMATEQGSKAVEAGVKQSSQAGESIQALADSVIEAAQAVSQIVASSQQQLIGMDQVAMAMENIKQASMQNAAGTKQSEKAVQNLTELGQRLKQLVERYKV